MSIFIETEFGVIEIANEIIATISGVSATECYGIVGMASTKLTDGFAELLRRENFSKGIIVRNVENAVEIDLHVIVAFGTKISEVSHNIQSKVKYALEESLGITVSSINIFVQGVGVSNEK